MGGARGLIWGNAALAVLCTPLHNEALDRASRPVEQLRPLPTTPALPEQWQRTPQVQNRRP